MFGRRKIAALAAEFLGTGILTLLVLSVQRSTIGVPFFVALAAGLTLALLYFAVGEISGGHFNPALTFGLWTARRVDTLRAVTYIAVQFLGAYLAYLLYTYYAKNNLQSIAGTFTLRVLVAEGVGTAVFAFGYAAVLYQGFSTGVRASVNGITYVVGVVAASAAAIGIINPAVTLGVKAWGWSYVAGPFIGAFVGVNLYKYLFGPVVGSNALVSMPSNTSAARTTATIKPLSVAGAGRTPRKVTAKAATRKTTVTRKTTTKRSTKK